jgi:hypothetical protein
MVCEVEVSDTCIIQVKHTSHDECPYYHARDAADALDGYIGEYEELGFICNVDLTDSDHDNRNSQKKWDRFEEKVERDNENAANDGRRTQWVNSDAWFIVLTEEELADWLRGQAETYGTVDHEDKDVEIDDDAVDDDDDWNLISGILGLASSMFSYIWSGFGTMTEEEWEEGAELYCEMEYGGDDDY